jgi:hypothetical protein
MCVLCACLLYVIWAGARSVCAVCLSAVCHLSWHQECVYCVPGCHLSWHQECVYCVPGCHLSWRQECVRCVPVCCVSFELAPGMCVLCVFMSCVSTLPPHNWLTNQLTNELSNWLADWLSDWVMNWLTDLPNDRLTLNFCFILDLF